MQRFQVAGVQVLIGSQAGHSATVGADTGEKDNFFFPGFYPSLIASFRYLAPRRCSSRTRVAKELNPQPPNPQTLKPSILNPKH